MRNVDWRRKNDCRRVQPSADCHLSSAICHQPFMRTLQIVANASPSTRIDQSVSSGKTRHAHPGGVICQGGNIGPGQAGGGQERLIEPFHDGRLQRVGARRTRPCRAVPCSDSRECTAPPKTTRAFPVPPAPALHSEHTGSRTRQPGPGRAASTRSSRPFPNLFARSPATFAHDGTVSARSAGRARRPPRWPRPG